MVQMLNDQLLTILLVLDIIHWLLFSVGLALFFGMMIWYFVRRRNNRNRNVQPTTSENKSWPIIYVKEMDKIGIEKPKIINLHL